MQHAHSEKPEQTNKQTKGITAHHTVCITLFFIQHTVVLCITFNK